MLSGATTTRLPSLRSITTRPPPRVSMRSPGLRMYPGVNATGAAAGLYSKFRPLTLAARATTGPDCAAPVLHHATSTAVSSRIAAEERAVPDRKHHGTGP